MTTPNPRIQVKITEAAGDARLTPGDVFYVQDGEVEAASTARLVLDVLHAAYPVIADCADALAQGDETPRKGRSLVGIEFTVERAPNRVDRAPRPRLTGIGDEVAPEPEPFLTTLDGELVQALRRASQMRTFAKNQLILQEGAEPTSVFLIDKGQVDVVRGSGADEQILATLGRGDVFGEMSILTGDPVSANVRARSLAVILVLERERLEALLVEYPALHREFSRLLALRLRAQASRAATAGTKFSILGSLGMIDPPDLVQSMLGARRTGRLMLSGAGGEGEIYFDEGQVIGARHVRAAAEEAFLEMMKLADGRFAFEMGDFTPPDEATIELDTMGLLMDTMRRIDEERLGG